MEKYFGFDLGDAESCVSLLNDVHEQTPEVLPITDKKSFITAYAMMPDGSLRIGENACYETGAVKRKLRFKSLFLKDRSCERDIRSFAQGVLGELYENDYLSQSDLANFYIGCPAGWNKNDRERYRAIFEAAGYPPAKIISESRAALVSACQSRHLQVGYDILAKPVLVVDIGSSTTDFAYVCQGKEMDIRTAGEVYLGGGIMDEILLEESINDSVGKDKIRQVFKESEAWKNYCEFAARRLKEKYYSDEDYFNENVCSESVMIHYDKPLRLRLIMNRQRAETLVNKPVERLDGKSFKEVFIQSLKNVKEGNLYMIKKLFPFRC